MDLISWTLGAIRGAEFEGIIMNWLEEQRVAWASLLSSKLGYFLDGASIVLVCDDEYSWFEEYFIKNINTPSKTRPLIPVVPLRSLYPRIDTSVLDESEMALLDDMLNISFGNNFVYFYIGKGSSKLSLIAKSHQNSYMWLFGEQAQNAFCLEKSDPLLDIKILALFRLFDMSLSEVILGKITL